ncbi:MAG: hypothetical protein PHH22_03680 [Clostridia bacterium]|nr:hypothetical protein [Clostridia bacterium]
MRNNKKGIALLEIVIAILILVSYIIFNTTVYLNSFNNVVEIKKLTIANNLLIQTAEEVRNMSYNLVTDSSEVKTISSYEFIINVDSTVKERIVYTVEGYTYTYQYKEIEVSIAWDDDVETLSVLKYNSSYAPVIVEPEIPEEP